MTCFGQDHVNSRRRWSQEFMKSFKWNRLAGHLFSMGISVWHVVDSIELHHKNYVALLEQIKMSKSWGTRRSDDLGSEESEEFQALVGQLIWVAFQMRQGVGFDVCQLSARTRWAKVKDILEASKFIKRLHSLTYSLFYSMLRDKEDLVIECYSDDSSTNLRDDGSQGGYILFLADRNGKRSVIS